MSIRTTWPILVARVRCGDQTGPVTVHRDGALAAAGVEVDRLRRAAVDLEGGRCAGEPVKAILMGPL